jgi:hypothetical protein
MRQLVSSDEARPAKRQHETPCSDCPWRRKALPGWLGSMTAEEWVAAAHSETRIDCHTLIGAQCAGAATYRANICKRPRDPELLLLNSDRVVVFARPHEFLDHHNHKGKPDMARGKAYAPFLKRVRDAMMLTGREIDADRGEYIEALEELSADIDGMIDAAKEEQKGDGEE